MGKQNFKISIFVLALGSFVFHGIAILHVFLKIPIKRLELMPSPKYLNELKIRK